jgi:DNA-directed RNA polymerase subunit alpha
LVEKGVGYLPREEREKEKLEIGVIPVDAIFTPVRKVAMRVENMRVGKRTDYDRLFLEVETDGTISPEEAFSKAAEILVNHFSFLAESFKGKEVKEHEEKKKREKTK